MSVDRQGEPAGEGLIEAPTITAQEVPQSTGASSRLLDECPVLLQQEDFLFASVYLPAGGFHTREDGSQGFYVPMEKYGGNLGFVPVRTKIISLSEQLRAELDKVEQQMMSTGTEIESLKKLLQNSELKEELRDSIEANLKDLERRKRLEYSKWKMVSVKLDQEEEKGTRVFYSLRDTEGKVIEKEDVYLQNIKPEKSVLRQEEVETSEIDSKYNKMYIETPAKELRIFSKQLSEDYKMIAHLNKKSARVEVEKKARGISYDLSMLL